jgi:hypothetical protein
MNYLPELASNNDLPILASQIARIIGMSHPLVPSLLSLSCELRPCPFTYPLLRLPEAKGLKEGKCEQTKLGDDYQHGPPYVQ